MLAISLFETEEQASASNDAASDYVAEHLAGLVPNPPLIVEGTVHIGFVEMLDVMGNGDVSSLYTSVRLYDEFETDNLDHFVSTVEDGFLPLMRETDGFFGYYLMDNGAGALAAISIFDSEASALASNEKARDFVTENLTAYLPNDPSITSGQLEVAALAAVNDGANLIDDMMDDSVFVSMRVYDGVDPIYHDEIVRLADEGFLPIMRESEGFVGYYLLLAGDMLAAISLFDTAEEASASNEAARDFVAENLAPYLPNAPRIVEGTVDVSTQIFINFDHTMTPEEMALPLYAALRIYEGVDMSGLEESNNLVETILLPAQMEAGGLYSYFSMNDGIGTVAGFSVFDSEESASAANEIAAAFVAEHLAVWLPDDPIRVSGRLAVAVVEGVLPGINAAEWETE